MSEFEVLAWLIILSAVFSYLNHVFLRVPRAIGLLLGGLCGAVALATFGHFFPGASLAVETRAVVERFNFAAFLLNGVLGFIIFAGALEVDVEELRNRRLTVLVLASAGVLISTLLVGYGCYAILNAFDIRVPLLQCLLFGALISPTDPVSVLAIMRDLSVSRRLQVEMAGESLFNDGIGIVVFSVILAASSMPSRQVSQMIVHGALLFVREGLGGCAIGLILGGVVYLLLKTIDDPHVEVLMSFALVSGIVLVSDYTHVSGPLGCAVAGLFIGHRARRNAMKEPTRKALDTVWSFTDFVLNAILFFVLGLLAFSVGVPPPRHLGAIAAIVLIVVAARFPSVWSASKLVPSQTLPLRSVIALTWGGLRGGLSVALALLLPAIPNRDIFLEAAYATVLFSLIVQGSTVAPLLRRLGLQRQEQLARS